MRNSFQTQKQDAVRNLENFYNNFLKEYNRQLSEMNVEEVFRNGAEKFTKFIDEAEIRLKKEERRLRRNQKVNDIKKGKFVKETYNKAKNWYEMKSPAFFVWADDKFTSVEGYVEGNLSQSGTWIKQQLPMLTQMFDKSYPKTIGRRKPAMKRRTFTREARRYPFNFRRNMPKVKR